MPGGGRGGGLCSSTFPLHITSCKGGVGGPDIPGKNAYITTPRVPH